MICFTLSWLFPQNEQMTGGSLSAGPNGSPGSHFSGFRLVPVADPPDVWVGCEGRVRRYDRSRRAPDHLVGQGRRRRGYDWVECGSCAAGWQVPHYAESVG